MPGQFREWYQPHPEVAPLSRDIAHLTDSIKHLEHRIMSALTDLQAAIAALITEAVTDLEAVIAKIGSTPPDDTAALQALTQQANDATAKLKSDVAALTTPAPPAA